MAPHGDSIICVVLYFVVVEGDNLSIGYGLFALHYFNRSFIYSSRMKGSTTMPLEIMMMGFFFTESNGYLQGMGNRHLPERSLFFQMAGIVIFFLGMGINICCDSILREAREKAERLK